MQEQKNWEKEGFVLSTLVGAIFIVRGICTLILLEHTFNDLRISIAPIVMGMLIVIVSIVAGKKQKLL